MILKSLSDSLKATISHVLLCLRISGKSYLELANEDSHFIYNQSIFFVYPIGRQLTAFSFL